MNSIISFVMAYLLGAIPAAVLVSKKFKGIDIREHGSKNAGLTNVFRVLGVKYAIPVALIDFGKGYVACLIAAKMVPQLSWAPLLAGALAVLGHSFTCFASFRGGKGVLTALGVFVFLAPVEAGIAFAVWLGILYWTGYVSLASMCGCIALGISLTTSLMNGQKSIAVVILGWVLTVFVIVKHKANIQRLLNGSENRFNTRKFNKE